MPNQQAYESAYLLVKARRLRDATLKLLHAAASSPVATQDPPAYLGQRVEEGQRELPEVAVRGLEVPTSGRGSRKRRNEALMLEQVVRRVVEGLSTELARELAEM
jgi:hypothetical protein